MDFTFIGVFARVGQQVQHHLPQPLFVRNDAITDIPRQLKGYGNLFAIAVAMKNQGENLEREKSSRQQGIIKRLT